MTEFPRGWAQVSNAPAFALASITIPAVPGVVHVLDQLTLRATNTTATLYGPTVTVGAITFQLFAFPNSTDELAMSGLDLASPPGAALVIAFAAVASSGTAHTIQAQGHDI